MEIQEIKQQLTINQVLEHYGLQPNKNKMLCCPFHDDKTPSMQVYPETNTVHCFSGNCEHTGKAIDQIDFIMHHEARGGQPITKHQAIMKAKELLGVVEPVKQQSENLNEIPALSLAEVFHQLKVNLPKSRKATEYLKSRELYDMKLDIGSNHQTSINGKTGYHYPKLKNCIVFPLRNQKGDIVSLYGRSLTSGHYYLENRKGLYPNYPSREARQLIITESIIDSATIGKYTEYETRVTLWRNFLLVLVPSSLKDWIQNWNWIGFI